MSSSISDTQDYRCVIKSFLSNESLYSNFKQNEIYQHILEHTTIDQGKIYMDCILKSKIDLSKIDKLKSNDEQGTPSLFDFGFPFNKISPSTLRYIKVLSDLETLFGSLNNFNIVEVGIGYGGQCKIINDYFTINSYSLIDLSEVINLSKKYLSKYNYNNINYYSFDDSIESLPMYDLFISNYAFSECDRTVQEFYIENFINTSKRGYMTCNFISSYIGVDSLTLEELQNKIKNVKIMDEIPLTHKLNKILYWNN